MFYDNESATIPWDYFLTEYERDLIKNSIEVLIIKYPNIEPNILMGDKLFMEETQAIFNN